MGPEAQAFISGNLSGLTIALRLLVLELHSSGAIDGRSYVRTLRRQFNDPEAKFEKVSYDLLRRLSVDLSVDLDELPQQDG